MVALPRPAQAALLYAALAIVCFWPLPLHLSDRVVGNLGEDTWQQIWNIWWIKTAWSSGRLNFYFTPLLYYNQGAALYLHDLAPVAGLLGVLLSPLAGNVASFNLAMIVFTILAALGAYLLTYALTGSHAGALLAGALFALSPDRIAHIVAGTPGLVSVAGIPLYVLALHQAAETGRPRWFAGVALSLALALASTWYYVLFLGLFAIQYGLARLIFPPAQVGRPRLARRLAVAAIASLLVVLPPFLVVARSATTPIPLSTALASAARFSADPLAFLLPSSFHPLFGPAVAPLRARLIKSAAEGNVYLGYAAIALAAVAVWFRREARLWLALAAINLLLALGPTLTLGGQTVRWPGGQPVRLPYAYLIDLPLVRIARVPARLSVLVSLCLAVLAAYGARELLRRLPPRRAWALLGAATLVCAVEYLPVALPQGQPLEVPAYFDELRADARPFGIFELPLAPRPSAQAARMYYQTIHGKAIYGGYLSRAIRYDVGEAIGERLDAADLPRVLATAGFRQVVLYKAQLSPGDLARYAKQFGALPLARDDPQVRVYRIPPVTHEVLLQPTQGWYAEEQAPGARFRWMRSPATLAVIASDAMPATFSFQLYNAARDESTVDVLVSGRLVGSARATKGRRVLIGPIDLPAGVSEITIAVREPNLSATILVGPNDRREISLALADLRVLPLSR